MGRSAKRIISIVTVLMVMLIPISTAYAAIGSLFAPASSSQLVIELATEYANSHDSLTIDVDGEIATLDDSVIHELLLTDNSHDNQGSGGVNVSIFTQYSLDSADWNHVYLDDQLRYELSSVSLPSEIRPPITL